MLLSFGNTTLLGKVIETIKAQPEVKIRSIFSHLADADNIESSEFTKQQIKQFEKAIYQICSQINYPIEKHLLNSEASAEYKDYQFDMVRLGIGVYGFASHPKIKKQLIPALKWKSSISQIKNISTGRYSPRAFSIYKVSIRNTYIYPKIYKKTLFFK